MRDLIKLLSKLDEGLLFYLMLVLILSVLACVGAIGIAAFREPEPWELERDAYERKLADIERRRAEIASEIAAIERDRAAKNRPDGGRP